VGRAASETATAAASWSARSASGAVASTALPSQEVGPGSEPLLYAATDAAAANGGYYGPSRWFGLVGPTTTVRPPRRARDTATATRLWAEAERLTSTALPASASRP
jgi:hypothetical protein